MPTPNPYNELADKIKREYGSTALNVTKRAITLGAHGSRDSTTGWRTITYAETAAEMAILPRGRGWQLHPPGFHAIYDYEGFTNSSTALVVGDQVKDAANNYYLVAAAVPYKAASATIQHYAYDLKQLTEWEAAAGATTWTLTRSRDPRYWMKYYIDSATGYTRPAQITKDNDTTQAVWACMFNDPPYPLHLEFRHAATPVQGLYVIGRTRSTAMIDHNMKAYGYRDDCVAHICTVDSTACTGWALMWKMEEELRYALEENPTGSLREFDSAEPKPVDIGGMWMHDMQVRILYERLKTE